METEQMNRQIAELEFLSGTLESADEFNLRYERMLRECKVAGDKATARKMQKVLFRQFIFLFNEWRREKGMVTAKDEMSNGD
jgi:hypothetical protein